MTVMIALALVIVFSFRNPCPHGHNYAPHHYKGPINAQDIVMLRSIGRKSINAFTDEEIDKAGKWAYKFWQQLGVKSPFFRRWFGDWRETDTSRVEVANEEGVKRSPGVKNADTGWDIILGKVLYDETKYTPSTSFENAVKYLPIAEDIVKKAVLLDTVVTENKPNKSAWSTFFHSFYVVSTKFGYPALLKLRVEELVNRDSPEDIRRTYTLQSIEEATVSSNQISGLNIETITSSSYTVADLHALGLL